MNDLTPKKGYLTTEFWVTLGPLAVVLLKMFGVDIGIDDVNNVLIGVAGVTAATYALSRTVLKIFRIREASTLTRLADPKNKPHVREFSQRTKGTYAQGPFYKKHSAPAGNDVTGADEEAPKSSNE